VQKGNSNNQLRVRF